MRMCLNTIDIQSFAASRAMRQTIFEWENLTELLKQMSSSSSSPSKQQNEKQCRLMETDFSRFSAIAVIQNIMENRLNVFHVAVS